MREERGLSTWPPLASLPGEVRPLDEDASFKPNLVAYQVTGVGVCVSVWVCAGVRDKLE